MNEFNMPNDSSIQEKNANSESEIISDNIGNDEEKNEKSKNNYDQPASQEEISRLREEIEEKVENKAKNLKISKEKLIDLADLDLESLDEKNLENLNLNQGGFEFIKESINEAINEFWRSEKTEKLVTGTTSKLEGSINEVFEFAKRHKKIVSLGELALYASSFGPAVLKDLAGDDVQVEIYGEKISLKDLADNPELIKTIDRARNYNSPVDILADYSPPEKFQHNDVEFSFASQDEINDDNSVERLLYFGVIAGNSENIKKLNNDLEKIGISFKATDKCSMDDFLKNEDEIINIFSKDLKIPEDEVEKYIESWLMPDVSNISVVEFEDFQINKDLKIPNDAMKLQQKQKDVYEKYEVYSENGSLIPENWLNASKELDKWGGENGYENFDKAIQEERERYNKVPAVKLELLKLQEGIEYKNDDIFKEIVIDMFEKEHYDIQELKEIAKNDPERIIEIISEVMAENIEYDFKEMKQIIDWQNNQNKDKEDLIIKKHSEGIPYATLESKEGVCHDYGRTFVAIKNVLKEEGVPNLENFASLWTTSEKQNHLWNAIATVNSEGNIVVSYLDPTWHDSPEGKLNAVDESHYYTSIKEKVDEVHQKALQKIKDYNILAFQEKLKEILTQYDPKLHKREQQIEGNKRLREQDRNIEITREEKTRNVKESLKSARNKLKKIYARKDSENE